MGGVASLPTLISIVCDGDDDDEGLLLVDWAVGASVMLARGSCGFARWSPDGRRLAFRRNGDLMLATAGRPEAEILIGGMPANARRPLAFHPNGRWLAAIIESNIMVLPIDVPEASACCLSVAPPYLADVLAWTGAGDTLAILCHPREEAAPTGAQDSQLLCWNPATNEIRQCAADFDLLGSRGPNDLVVTQTVDGSTDRRAALYTNGGQVLPLFEAPDGQFVYDYLRRSDAVVLGHFGEDPGVAVDLEIAPVAGGAPKPCLQELWGVLEITFSDSGEHAVVLRDPTLEMVGADYLGILDVALGTLSWDPGSALRNLEGAILRQALVAPAFARWTP